MNKFIATAVLVALVLLILCSVFFGATPSGVALWNSWFHTVQKVDDNTNYKTLKKVEDTCRAMISSYEADKLTYEQYQNSDDDEKQSWAEKAKMRANRTAASYNNYILENNYVWADNVPADIAEQLDYIK